MGRSRRLKGASKKKLKRGCVPCKKRKTKRVRSAVRSVRGGYLGPGGFLTITDIAGALTNLIKKKPAPYVGSTSDPTWYQRHSKVDGQCLHPKNKACPNFYL